MTAAAANSAASGDGERVAADGAGSAEQQRQHLRAALTAVLLREPTAEEEVAASRYFLSGPGLNVTRTYLSGQNVAPTFLTSIGRGTVKAVFTVLAALMQREDVTQRPELAVPSTSQLSAALGRVMERNPTASELAMASQYFLHGYGLSNMRKYLRGRNVPPRFLARLGRGHLATVARHLAASEQGGGGTTTSAAGVIPTREQVAAALAAVLFRPPTAAELEDALPYFTIGPGACEMRKAASGKMMLPVPPLTELQYARIRGLVYEHMVTVRAVPTEGLIRTYFHAAEADEHADRCWRYFGLGSAGVKSIRAEMDNKAKRCPRTRLLRALQSSDGGEHGTASPGAVTLAAAANGVAGSHGMSTASAPGRAAAIKLDSSERSVAGAVAEAGVVTGR